MPLTEKGHEIMAAMKKEYGESKGEEVFYASRNAGTITGVDRSAYDFGPVDMDLTLADLNRMNSRSFARPGAQMGTFSPNKEQMPLYSADLAKDADFKESDHPRANNGEFISGGGGSGSAQTKITKAAATEKVQAASKESLHKALNNPNTDPKIKKLIEKELDDRANRGS